MEANGGGYAPQPGKIPGARMNLGGRELVLAPLNLQQVEQFESVLPELGKQGSLRDALSTGVPIIHASLSRNYPEITLDEVRGLLDIGNFREALDAMLGISGYSRRQPGEPTPASP